MPSMISSGFISYRTFVYLSFDDEEQNTKVAACWQLWEENCDLSKPDCCEGKQVAVEYIESHIYNQHHVQIKRKSFDRLSITWTADPTVENPRCSVHLRFNFLSTDFSRSKGVRGIPVRFYIKTQVISPQEPVRPLDETKVAYYRIKVFRPHGAERKLKNDTMQTKKEIQKLGQRIAQAESNLSKRKRDAQFAAKPIAAGRSTKISKHTYTRAAAKKHSIRDTTLSLCSLKAKMTSMQCMLSSACSENVLVVHRSVADEAESSPA